MTTSKYTWSDRSANVDVDKLKWYFCFVVRLFRKAPPWMFAKSTPLTYIIRGINIE